MSLQVRLIPGGQIVTLSEVLGSGGQGTVHGVDEDSSLAIKLYDNPDAETEERINCQIDVCSGITWLAGGNAKIASPKKIVQSLDADARFLGYAMERFGKSYRPLRKIITSSKISLEARLHYARNICWAIRDLHRQKIKVGDISWENIWANQHGETVFLDVDSWQFHANGKTFLCGFGREEFLPPELYGKTLACTERHDFHDTYSLAVIIFLLLMHAYHPFSSKYVGKGIGKNLRERIHAGLWPYSPKTTSRYKPSENAPSYSMIHPQLQILFTRCFVQGHKRPNSRPSASLWNRVLKKAESDLKYLSTGEKHFQDHLNNIASRSAATQEDTWSSIKTYWQFAKRHVVAISVGGVAFVILALASVFTWKYFSPATSQIYIQNIGECETPSTGKQTPALWKTLYEQ